MIKVLIADDEQDVLAVLQRKLSQHAMETRAVSRGREVLDQARDFRPDVIVQDVVMGDTDGYSVAAAVRRDQELSGVPFIFMTGHELPHESLERKTHELGPCDFVFKPCTFEELLQKIKKITAGKS